jgi:hypothetical protein
MEFRPTSGRACFWGTGYTDALKAPPKKRKAANGRTGILAIEATRFGPGSLEAELEEIASKIPRGELRRLPRDLGSNVDHYLYGTPKR